MARGSGYGSEDHIRRYLDEYPTVVAKAIAATLGIKPSVVSWLPFPMTTSGDREYRGIEFLAGPEYASLREAWRAVWPVTGRQQSWDAVGRAGSEWLLVEAKANAPEFCTPASTASPASRTKIVRALNKTKRRLGVHRFYAWDASYYQYANRLTMLDFLRQRAVPAHLVFIYFTGDQFPDDTPCPQTAADWEPLLEARRVTLGLPRRHDLSPYEHHVFLPALSG
jgi:hypothetical protein